MRPAIHWSRIWLLVAASAGCGPATEGSSADEPPFEAAPPDKPEQESQDRTQTSYFTTLVTDSDGERYTDGQASLTIADVDDHADITLTIEAWNERGGAWSAQIKLPEDAVLNERAAKEFDIRPGAIQIRSRASNPKAEGPISARLELTRMTEPGKRPLLQGFVHRASAARSAEFRTEYTVECLVPPEALGLTPNGSPDPSTPVLGVFVPDERFESSFCQGFARIR